jgi:uncharacterized surface protein with fasciclin (FAS1) repeats
MRKLSFLLTAFVMVMALAIPAAPATAQEDGQTIVEIASNNEDFSTLVTAVQAADPAIAEALSNPGPYTVFAPTNAAFEALGEDTLNAVLEDQAQLTNILQYHVVEGEFFAEDVLGLDGQSVTTLNGQDVNISVQDGTVFVNEAQVITTDIDASNGVIHVIDSVLLPPAADAGDMDDEMMEEAPMVTVRVGHFSPDTPAVDVFLNGERTLEGLEYPGVTDWVDIPEGSYDIDVAPAGASIEEAAISLDGVEVAVPNETDRISIVAVGSLEDGTLKPQILVEDYSAPAPGEARIEAFHAIEGAPRVDIYANGGLLIEFLGFPGESNDGKFIIDVPAGNYNLDVNVSNTQDTLLSVEDFEVQPYVSYFIAAIGTPEEPDVFVNTTDLPLSNTIADIAIGSDDFSTLVTAIQAADPSVLQTLSTRGEYTVFAPNNAAFAVLDESTLNAVLEDQALLTDILLAHVVAGELTSEDILNRLAESEDGELRIATLLDGETILVTLDDAGNVFVDGIQVVAVDIEAANGIIHVLGDGVIMPDDDMPDDDMSDEGSE